MKHNKTHKRNKNTKKFNINTGKKEKRKTIKMKRSNSLIGGEGPLKFPSVDIIAKFIRKQDKDNYKEDKDNYKDANRFDINITSHYSFLDYLFEVEDFLKRFELDLLNYTDKSEYVKLMQTYKDTESKKSMQITIGKKGEEIDGDGENEDDDDHDEEEEEEEEDRDEEEEEEEEGDGDDTFMSSRENGAGKNARLVAVANSNTTNRVSKRKSEGKSTMKLQSDDTASQKTKKNKTEITNGNPK